VSEHLLGADPSLVAPTSHRFLSAHYDDIALSCGGTVALLAKHGLTPEIRVAFGAAPDPGHVLSAFAEEQHRRWGLDAGQVIDARRAEEAEAATLLGASSRALSLRDAIYRGAWYQSDVQLFGAIAAEEVALPGQIAAEVCDPTDDRATTRFYVPLAVGNHVDHQLCFAAGLDLAAAGWDVWFYEDIPYGLQPGALDRRLDQIDADWETIAPPALRGGHLEPAGRVVVTDVWDRKLRAILAYASQVRTIFRQIAPNGDVPAAIEAALRQHALREGDGNLVEQVWRIAGSDEALTST
jgi:LmbE family N-acetylglucosaminyl deacetylase